MELVLCFFGEVEVEVVLRLRLWRTNESDVEEAVGLLAGSVYTPSFTSSGWSMTGVMEMAGSRNKSGKKVRGE